MLRWVPRRGSHVQQAGKAETTGKLESWTSWEFGEALASCKLQATKFNIPETGA